MESKKYYKIAITLLTCFFQTQVHGAEKHWSQYASNGDLFAIELNEVINLRTAVRKFGWQSANIIIEDPSALEPYFWVSFELRATRIRIAAVLDDEEAACRESKLKSYALMHKLGCLNYAQFYEIEQNGRIVRRAFDSISNPKIPQYAILAAMVKGESVASITGKLGAVSEIKLVGVKLPAGAAMPTYTLHFECDSSFIELYSAGKESMDLVRGRPYTMDDIHDIKLNGFFLIYAKSR